MIFETTLGTLKSVPHITSFRQLRSYPNGRGTLVFFKGIEDNIYCIQKLQTYNVDVHLTQHARQEPLNIDVMRIFPLKTLLRDEGRSHCSSARIPLLTSPLLLSVSLFMCTCSRFSHPLRTWNAVPLACVEPRVFFRDITNSDVGGNTSCCTCFIVFGHHGKRGQQAFLGPYTRKGF